MKEDSLSKIEFDRVSQKKASTSLDTTRYKLEGAPINKQSDVTAWKQALQNAQSQLEHQHVRLTNLELLQTYGPNAWRHYNEYLESVHRYLTHMVEQESLEVEELNRQRKDEQVNISEFDIYN